MSGIPQSKIGPLLINPQWAQTPVHSRKRTIERYCLSDFFTQFYNNHFNPYEEPHYHGADFLLTHNANFPILPPQKRAASYHFIQRKRGCPWSMSDRAHPLRHTGGQSFSRFSGSRIWRCDTKDRATNGFTAISGNPKSCTICSYNAIGSLKIFASEILRIAL